MKKILAVLLTVLLTLMLAGTALAEEAEAGTLRITVTEFTGDGMPAEYDSAAEDHVYLYYPVFDSDGEGWTTQEVSLISTLGSWDSVTETWTKAEGNLWFDLTPVPETDAFTVICDNVVDTEEMTAAAEWLLSSGILHGTEMHFENNSWTAEGSRGCYLLQGPNYLQLLDVTADVNVNVERPAAATETGMAEETVETATEAESDAETAQQMIEEEAEAAVPPEETVEEISAEPTAAPESVEEAPEETAAVAEESEPQNPINGRAMSEILCMIIAVVVTAAGALLVSRHRMNSRV